MRVLIVKRDKLGDLLLTTAAFAHLKAVRPDIELHLLANDYNAWVARDDPALARIWVYPRVRHDGRVRPAAAFAHVPLAWKLRSARFDWAIAMGGEESPRAVRRAIATGARRVVAYVGDPARYGRGLTDPLPTPSTGHEITRMLSLLAPLQIQPPAHAPTPAIGGRAKGRRSRAHGSPSADSRAANTSSSASARGSLCKQPTLAQILDWTAAFRDQVGIADGVPVDAGPGGCGLLSRRRRIGGACPCAGFAARACASRTLTEALALIANARASIMPDSGLMHFAAASPGGVVGLFADPQASGAAERWGPVGPRAHYLQARKAVAEIGDDVVLDALERLVADSPRFD